MLELDLIPGDFLVNPVAEGNGLVQSDFVLHGLRLANLGAGPIRLHRITFALHAGGKRVREVVYPGEALAERLAALRASVGHLTGWSAQLFLGRERFWDLERLAATTALEPGDETGLFSEFFVHVHSAPIDALEIRIGHEEAGRALELSRTLPVVQHRNRTAYAFPVRGLWQVNGNYDCLFAHRGHHSMEFALDVAKLDLDVRAWEGRPRQDADWPSFGHPVRAIAAGEVVACFGDMPKQVRFSLDPREREQVWEERKKLIEEYGVLPQQCGNHVVIRHDGGEHSFYGHLAHRSLTVAQGDRVAQGQPIGTIGNTGLTACPHLHFQLMDGPDFLTARGLPCHFTGIRNLENRPLSLIQEEYTMVVTEEE
jgi:hypothetical protein